MKSREPMEVTASRCQARSTCGKGSGATSPGEAQQLVADNRRRSGFHLVDGRGLLLAKSAGAKAARGTFPTPTPAGANEPTRHLHSRCRENEFHRNAVSDYKIHE